MNVFEKAKVLSEASHFDSCGPKPCEVKINSGLGGIYHAKAEHRTCRIFKTLMSNACAFDCRYCANPVAKKKVSYEPKELAALFSHMHTNMNVNGLFLSSGVAPDPDIATEKMLEAVRIIRFKLNFQGYVHFKVLPGTSYELIRQASEVSSRMSINIEAPDKNTMNELGTCKDFKIDILRRQAWISRMNLQAGQSTQMILNRFSTDRDVLRMADWQYRKLGLNRVYYSAFSPVKHTEFENETPEPVSRQNHLYNADFLIRDYGFKLKEFSKIMDNGMLPDEDPKLALARLYFEKPLEINDASYDELIRIPGIGPDTAWSIVRRKITQYRQLYRISGSAKKAAPFIKINGKRQSCLCEFQ